MALIKYEQTAEIVTITLNRPESLNAINREMLSELSDAWAKYDSDPNARVAILTGTGRAFSAGMDVKELGSRADQVDGISQKSSLNEEDTTGGMARVKKPIITAINGLALGAGCIMVLESDIRIAARSAALGMTEIKLGLYGNIDMLIAQGIPVCIAMELALTGEFISADRAYEVGLINMAVPDNDLLDTATKVAGKIAELSPLAVRLNKQIGIKAMETRQEVLELRQEVFEVLRNSEDSREGLKAFAEKRKAVFKGK